MPPRAARAEESALLKSRRSRAPFLPESSPSSSHLAKYVMEVSKGTRTAPSSRRASRLQAALLQVCRCSAQTRRQCAASDEGTLNGGWACWYMLRKATLVGAVGRRRATSARIPGPGTTAYTSVSGSRSKYPRMAIVRRIIATGPSPAFVSAASCSAVMGRRCKGCRKLATNSRSRGPQVQPCASMKALVLRSRPWIFGLAEASRTPDRHGH
mmetsp:Transcript_68927/g.191925  ORF Transcript_68927/g.191925 Transcript_68927/m.191925 type:complete len:212 (+) Transcript_68927:1198-1833(+)